MSETQADTKGRRGRPATPTKAHGRTHAAVVVEFSVRLLSALGAQEEADKAVFLLGNRAELGAWDAELAGKEGSSSNEALLGTDAVWL